MRTTADPTSTVRRQRAVVATVVILGALTSTWWMRSADDQAATRVVHGWAHPNADGTAIGLAPSPGAPGDGYVVAGAWWTDAHGSTFDGGVLPTCIGDDPSRTTRVELEVVDVESRDGLRWTEVVWVHCLE